MSLAQHTIAQHLMHRPPQRVKRDVRQHDQQDAAR